MNSNLQPITFYDYGSLFVAGLIIALTIYLGLVLIGWAFYRKITGFPLLRSCAISLDFGMISTIFSILLLPGLGYIVSQDCNTAINTLIFNWLSGLPAIFIEMLMLKKIGQASFTLRTFGLLFLMHVSSLILVIGLGGLFVACVPLVLH